MKHNHEKKAEDQIDSATKHFMGVYLILQNRND
jgi:hypothetical protein